jgi:hypothetical protein
MIAKNIWPDILEYAARILTFAAWPFIIGMGLSWLLRWRHSITILAWISYTVFSFVYARYYWSGFNEGGDMSGAFAQADNVFMRAGITLGILCGYFELLHVLMRQHRKNELHGFVK